MAEEKDSKTAIIVAIIGLVAVLTAAIIANIDKLSNIGSQSNANNTNSAVVVNSPPPISTNESRPSGTKTAEPTTIDQTDAKATAGAILKAYKSRDVITWAGLNSPVNRRIFFELAEQGENHPRYKSIFSGSRWEAVQAWDGQIGDVRYKNSQARVKFGELGPDEVLVVTLNWIDGKWFWEDIHSPSREDFESGSKTR